MILKMVGAKLVTDEQTAEALLKDRVEIGGSTILNWSRCVHFSKLSYFSFVALS